MDFNYELLCLRNYLTSDIGLLQIPKFDSLNSNIAEHLDGASALVTTSIGLDDEENLIRNKQLFFDFVRQFSLCVMEYQNSYNKITGFNPANSREYHKAVNLL